MPLKSSGTSPEGEGRGWGVCVLGSTAFCGVAGGRVGKLSSSPPSGVCEGSRGTEWARTGLFLSLSCWSIGTVCTPGRALPNSSTLSGRSQLGTTGISDEEVTAESCSGIWEKGCRTSPLVSHPPYDPCLCQVCSRRPAGATDPRRSWKYLPRPLPTTCVGPGVRRVCPSPWPVLRHLAVFPLPPEATLSPDRKMGGQAPEGGGWSGPEPGAGPLTSC